MGKLTLHTGSTGSYYYFKDDVIKNLSINVEASFLYLLPVNRAVRYLKKQLATEIEKKALLDPPVFTFRSFIRDLYDHFPEKKKVISPSMRLLLLQHILKSNDDRFNYFPSEVNFGNGLIIKAERMVEEFFQFGFRPEDFEDPPLSAENKFSDFGYLINRIFNLYQDRLIDESSLTGEVSSLLNENILKEYYPTLDKVYISGFGIYSPPMFEFVKHLKENYEVEIKLEFNSENEELFRHTTDAYERLSRISDQIIKRSDDLEVFSRQIFKPVPVHHQKDSFPVNVEIQKLYNRTDEINFIVTKIKQRHHLDNIPLHEIGITFPDIEKYVPLIKNIFKDYDIPFNLSTGFNLAESPLIQSFIQVLRIVVSQFQTDEVYKLALSPFLKQKLIEEAGIINESARKIRLNYFQTNWDQKIRQLLSKGDYDEPLMRISGKISNEKLDELLENISTLLATIKPLAARQSAEDFQKTYMDVLGGLGLLEWYDHDQGILSIQEKEREFRAFNRFIKLLDQVVWILKYIHGSDPIDIVDYFNYLTIVLENSTYNLREWSDYGVQIMPRLEILSLELDTLFVGGLVEGDFPRHFTRDIFFNDEERAEIGLNASEDLLGQDRFLFHQLITCGAKNVQLCYPTFEGENNLLSSTFLTSLLEVISSIEIKTNTSINEYLSPSSVPEYLGNSLKSEFSDADKSLYLAWINNEPPEKVSYWKKGIRSLSARKNYRQVTSFEGNLTNSKTVCCKLEKYHIKRPFSITALESYAFCPMQYFLQRILRLEPDEETEATITSLERGNAIHKVLYKYYSHLNTEERHNPWEHGLLLQKIARDVFKTLPYRDILWIVEKEKYFGSPSNIGLWDKFLETEKEHIQQSGFVPAYFESEFGYLRKGKGKNSSSPALVIKRNGKEIRIYGKIDRIDVDKKGRFIVVDYKSGQGAMKIKITDMREGSSLQLPVYIAAAENILKEKQKNITSTAGVYYQVQDVENCKIKFVMINREKSDGLTGPKDIFLPNPKHEEDGKELTVNDIIENSFAHISVYVDKMASGNFKHTSSPKDIKCTSYCAYNRVCRKDTGKLMFLQE
jgi:ATP-dependent helicase/nuclease subunit B